MPKTATIAPNYSVEYEDVGQGQTLVLLHAFPLNPHMWQPQFGSLNARIIAPNLYGSPARQSTLSVEQMADDVAALLDHLQINFPIALGGLSMGGYVAMAFAQKYAQRLRALILADTRMEADTPETKANREKTIALAQCEGARGVWQSQKAKMFSPHTFEDKPGIIPAATVIAERQTSAQIIAATKALRDRSDSTESLSKLQIPTLIIVGQDDAITPPDASRAMQNVMPDARLEIITRAGHLSNWEQPTHFNNVVRNWLS